MYKVYGGNTINSQIENIHQWLLEEKLGFVQYVTKKYKFFALV